MNLATALASMSLEPGAEPVFLPTEAGFEERQALEGGGNFVRRVNVVASHGTVAIDAFLCIESAEGQPTMILSSPRDLLFQLTLRQTRALAKALERAGDRLAIAQIARGA